MNLDQQLAAVGITQDLFATVFESPVPAAPVKPTGPDLGSELMAIMRQHRAVSIFKLGELHFELTGRCHHQCQIWDVMFDLEQADKVRCDFSTGERVWHLREGK